MANELLEHTLLTNLRHEYEAQGYAFYANPPPEAVPPFLAGFQPDAIATRQAEGVVLELKPRTASRDALKHIAELFEGQTRWRFRVIFYDLPPRDAEIDSSDADIAGLIFRVERLRDRGEEDAALLLAWSVLENVVRSKIDFSQRRVVMSSFQIAELLETLGLVSDDEAGLLGQSATLRNSLAHGRFDLRPGTGSIDIVIQIANDLNKRKTKIKA